MKPPLLVRLALCLLAWPMVHGAEGPLPLQAALDAFTTDPGLLVEPVATEPLVRSPAAFAWDEHLQLFVVENPGYPTGPTPGQPPVGALVSLADADGDGRADTRTVFADGLAFPNGLLRWRGGWLVTDAPNLWWLADTNHDGRADVRELWFTGFATNQSTQLRACYPTLGPDGWIYIARGLSSGHVTSPKWPELPAVDLKGGDFRFRPDGSAAETIGGNAQFGLVIDDVGRRFLVSNRNPLMHAVVLPRFWHRHPGLPFTDLVQDVSPSGYEARVYPRSPDSTTAGFMPEFLAAPHAGSFTAACGIHQYGGEGLGPGDQGAWFICEPAQNLVQRQQATPEGPTFRSHRSPEGRDFLTSTDSWFRPVFIATAPDGSLVLADLYRKVIDHPDYLPERVRGQLDYNAGKEMGRLWRIRHAGVSLPQPSPPARQAPEERIASLGATNVWVRQTSHRLLVEDGPDPLLLGPLVQALERDLPVLGSSPDWRSLPRRAADPATGPHLGTARRLWILASLVDAGPSGGALARRARAALWAASLDESPAVRETAWRIALSRAPDLKHALPDVPYDLVAWWAEDPNPAVRFQFALACGDQQDWSPVVPALAAIARRDADDRWTRAAVLSGLRHREDAFLTELLHPPLPDTEGFGALLHDLARLSDATDGETPRRLLDLALDPAQASQAWPLAILQGLSTSLRNAGGPPLATFIRRSTTSPGQTDPDPRTTRFVELGVRLLSTCLDAAVPASRRVAAVEFLAELDPSQQAAVLETLRRAIAPGQALEIRLAAARTLGRLDTPGAAALLAARERWTSDPPVLRDAAVSALASRARGIPSLLEAMERGDAPLWVLDPQRRRQWQNHPEPALRERARKLFAQGEGGDRRKVLEDLRPVLQWPASGARGQAVFERSCAGCHTLDGTGIKLGPDLSNLRNQPAEALLLHILVPEAEIYPGYQACDIETRDGRSLTGLLIAETSDMVVLRRAGGEEDRIPRSNLTSLSLSKLSLMPQELEKTMSRQELADLIARLRGQP